MLKVSIEKYKTYIRCLYRCYRRQINENLILTECIHSKFKLNLYDLHRRLLRDEVMIHSEALNEAAYGQGLIVRGRD